MNTSWWLLNVAYAVYVVSPVFKDILKLRAVLLGATVLYIAYGFASGIMSVTWWNIPFGLMHVYHIRLLMKERYGSVLTDDEEMYRKSLFPSLSAAEFEALWSLGTEERVDPRQALVYEGATSVDVMLLIEGAADVHLGGDRTIRLRPGALIGEMSMMRNEPACATVRASGPTVIRRFERKALIELGAARPEIQNAALLLIGQQLAAKALTPAMSTA